MLCLTETWLRPNELCLIKETLDNEKCVVFNKSGMCEAEPDYNGRPYGGVAIMCQQSDIFKYHELSADSDRIIGVTVSDNTGSVVQVIFAMYMPLFQHGNGKQTELYIETVDKLQPIISQQACLIR